MSNEYDTARAQYENYRFCFDNGHKDFLEVSKLCFDFWRGKQWDPAVKAKLEREGRPTLTLNVIESLVRAMEGVQCALRNDVRFIASQDATSEDARIRDVLWLHTQNQNAFDILETNIYKKGLIMGRAFYDCRVEYNDSMMGEIKIRGRRSQDVVLDPGIEEYDPDTWPQVFTKRWVSYDDIYQLYGKDKADAVAGENRMPGWYDYEDIMMAQQMGSLPYYNYTRMNQVDLKGMKGHLMTERQYSTFRQKDVFVDVNTGDWSEIPETWDRERIGRVLQLTPGLNTTRKSVRTLRWTVTCQDEVLHDEDSPYNHFTLIPYFPNYIDGISMGAVQSLIDPQQLYNKMTSSELHIISTTANSGYKLKSGSLKNMTVDELGQNGSRTGFVAELEDVNDLEKIQPNQTPQGMDRLSFKADNIMRSLAGVSNQSRGFAREDVASEAILSNQAAQEVNFAGWLSNLHHTKQLVARNVLDCARTHYTENRVIQINRGSAFLPQMDSVELNQPTPEGDVINDITAGKFSTTLIPAPSRTTLSESDFKMLLELRKEVGIQIPDALLIELSPASNKTQILESLKGGEDSNERQRAAEAAAAQTQQLELQKVQAVAAKEQAAAQLNQARAEKFAIEAASDPDASYERVEMARIEADRATTVEAHALKRRDAEARLALDTRKADDQREFQHKQIALRLAEIDMNEKKADKDREQAAKQTVQQVKNRPARKAKN